MAIKDLIVPSFIGTNTIEFIVTRGFGVQNPIIQYYVPANTLLGNLSDVDRFKKGAAITGYTFSLVNRLTGAALTSGTIVSKITKDGGVQASTTGSAVHEGNGQWSINLTATEMDADVVALSLTHANAIATYTVFKTNG